MDIDLIRLFLTGSLLPAPIPFRTTDNRRFQKWMALHRLFVPRADFRTILFNPHQEIHVWAIITAMIAGLRNNIYEITIINP